MLTDTLTVQREYASLKREELAGKTRSGALPNQRYDDHSVRKTFCSELVPFNTERPEALWDNFCIQRQRGRESPTGVYMQQVADSENFWLFWFWHPGLLHQQTLGRRADKRSVAFDMSNKPVNKMEDNSNGCEQAFATMYDELQELENQAKDRGEVPTSTEDSESDDGIDDTELYFWQCKFCPAQVDTRADLKTHIDNKHLTDIFRFLCCQCQFAAQGPRDLMEHIVRTHGNKNAWSAANIAIIDMELNNPQDAGRNASRREESREIITLSTTDLSESSGTEAEIVVLEATDISNQESDTSNEGWMCAICLTTFDTEEQWRDHEDFGTCSDRTTPVKLKRKSKKKRRRPRRYCQTCRTLFNSERSNDDHEPCPNSKVPKGGVMYNRKIKAATTRGQHDMSTSQDSRATPQTEVRRAGRRKLKP